MSIVVNPNIKNGGNGDNGTMKKSIEWHLGCLKNWGGSIERERLAYERAKANLQKMETDFNLYKRQIEKAQAMGKESFDSSRFKV